MAKDPAFLFYSGDFMSGTQFLTDEQVGKYVRLLIAQHQCGHLEEKHMLQICKTYDKDVFSKFDKDINGLFYNQRLENEIIKRKKYSESRSKNRASKTDISFSYQSDMENENRNENRNTSETEKIQHGKNGKSVINFAAQGGDILARRVAKRTQEIAKRDRKKNNP